MKIGCLMLCAMTALAPAKEWFVAPDGADDSRGSELFPFATITRAQKAASPGDTVTIRGGSYRMSDAQIARIERIWAYVILLDKSGREGRPIRYRAAPGERPIFDFSAVRPPGRRVHAFEVRGSHLVIEGLEVVGVQVTAKGHTQSICFSNRGSHNRYERLAMHDGMGIGFYLSRGADNLVLNCDAWNNHDPVSGDGRGGNVDGFGCHPGRGDTGNVFRGCRAWHNADDGYDTISAHEAVQFEHCWAMENGLSPEGESLGDGNGFKIGGFGLEPPRGGLPDPIPRHTVTRCLAVGNKANGFYANHHPGGGDWIHNSAFRNRRANFSFLGRDFGAMRDLPGAGHVIRNNLSFRGGRREVADLDEEHSELAGNLFGDGLRERDFLSLDPAGLTGPRGADGSLPVASFLRPRDRRGVIDRGEPRDESYVGEAPDPGAFEFDAAIRR